MGSRAAPAIGRPISARHFSTINMPLPVKLSDHPRLICHTFRRRNDAERGASRGKAFRKKRPGLVRVVIGTASSANLLVNAPRIGMRLLSSFVRRFVIPSGRLTAPFSKKPH
ncbi:MULTISPECIES: hypothetical protein [Burkholderia]|uniref:hypothetical protein n=1 Tax=Burkholderia TaxID=32008 RepID=UPI0011AF4B5F|nr:MULTISPECIES: hypothetical protein [unclassified Burkholderia]